MIQLKWMLFSVFLPPSGRDTDMIDEKVHDHFVSDTVFGSYFALLVETRVLG